MGDYLSNKAAAAVCNCLGFLAIAWLFLDAQRRYAPAMPAGMLAAMLLAIGLTTALPTLLVRVDVWEGSHRRKFGAQPGLPRGSVAGLASARAAGPVARRGEPGPGICGGLAADHGPPGAAPRTGRWLRQQAGSRPPLRPGLLAAAGLPFGACLAALALYNYARFGQLLEFGQRYQLPFGEYESHIRHFSPAYLWDNLRVYFLHPAPWKAAYPFVSEPSKLTFHSGHSGTEYNFGVLANVPLVWFRARGTAGLPAARRARLPGQRRRP